MPEGQWSFLESPGPRKKITVQVSPKADVLLKVAASMFGTSYSGQLVDVVERWADDFLARHEEMLAAAVAEERERRARDRSPVQRPTLDGRSVDAKDVT